MTEWRAQTDEEKRLEESLRVAPYRLVPQMCPSCGRWECMIGATKGEVLEGYRWSRVILIPQETFTVSFVFGPRTK